MKVPNLSLVVLAYNEEESIGWFLEETLAWLSSLPGGRHEVIVVDDGCSDGTADVVRSVMVGDERVRLVSHATNQGMGAGMRSGIAAARGDYFVMLPADGQVPADRIDVLLPQLERAPLVLSVYERRPGERYRVLLSRGLRVMMRVLLGTSFRLEGIYLFPVHVAREEIGLTTIGAETFFFSFELITRALQLGYRAETVVIRPRKRQAGASKVANLRRIRRVADELVRFRVRLLREQLGDR